MTKITFLNLPVEKVDEFGFLFFCFRWMLPRPSDLDNPDFDFESAIQRFKSVTNAHGFNGTKLCIENVQRGNLNPVDYNVGKEIGNYLDNFLKVYEEYLRGDDTGKLLRTAFYFCLLGKNSFVEIRDFSHFLYIFEAFCQSQNFLFHFAMHLK